MTPGRAESSMPGWTVEPRSTSAELPPLVVFPHAGAGAAVYRRLAVQQADRFHTAIVVAPGRERRLHEVPCRSMSSLVHAALAPLWPLLRQRPVLYGHSMGALVAFEIARRARDLGGVEPAHLVLSGCAAPRDRVVRRFRHHLPDHELWQSVCDLNGMPNEVARDPAMRDMLLPAMRADFRVCETYSYSPGPPLTCPI